MNRKLQMASAKLSSKVSIKWWCWQVYMTSTHHDICPLAVLFTLTLLSWPFFASSVSDAALPEVTDLMVSTVIWMSLCRVWHLCANTLLRLFHCKISLKLSQYYISREKVWNISWKWCLLAWLYIVYCYKYKGMIFNPSVCKLRQSLLKAYKQAICLS